MPALRIRMVALRNKPPNFRTTQLVADVIALQRRRAARIVAELQEYPPEIPGQAYVRTNRLHDAWEILPSQVNVNGVTTEYRNMATDDRGRQYAGYVYGTRSRGQAFMHVGRWPRAYDNFRQDVSGFRRELAFIVRRNIVPG